MTDPRTARSREALLEAVTAALETDDRTPTITELCGAAGVSRPTFYLHFGDVPSLIEAAALARLERLFAEVAPAPESRDWRETAPRVIRDLLIGLAAHAPFYRRVLTGPANGSFHERVVAYMTARLLQYSPLRDAPDADPHARRLAMFLAAGATWLVTRWLLEPAPAETLRATVDELADLLLTTTPTHV